jgi:hypothetical protein
MRCRLCGFRAGWFRRRCATCTQLQQVVAANRGAGLSLILDLLLATGAPRAHIEAFLAADPEGAGSIRDQIVADMSNELLQAFGQPSRQSAAEVKRIRERGAWSRYGGRPPDGR